MAKYDVKFSCGHVETIQLYGKEADRAKKIAWLEEHGICTACYKARIAAAHAAETAAAAAKAAEENLPELNGSEKQVNWALSIRAKKFADLDKMLADMTTTDEQLRRKNQIAIQATKNVLAIQTNSRFWIDNRNVEARKLIAANNLQDELKAEFARLDAEASATEEVDPDEYAVSTEAQEIAINAEIELATANNTKETIEMTTMTDADKAIAERKTMTRRELFLEAKKEITYKLNARGAKIWYISYSRYDISGKYIGHTPALKCTRKEVVAYLRDNYCGLTVDDFLSEQKAWIDEETTKAINQMNIDDQAEHVSDKVTCEVKPCDDNDNVFALLPELDELNDVSDIAPVIQPLRQTFVFTPVGNERHQILTSGDVVTFLNGKLHHITSTKYAAWFSVCFCHYAWHIFKDGKIDGVNGTNDEEEFFAEMAKRGACTIDEPEPPVDTDKPVDDYDNNRQERIARNQLVSKWNAELADLKAGLSKMSGKHQKRGVLGTYKLEFGLYVTTTNDECKYLLKVAGLPIATYDTPAQVDKVIDMLREAIERGETEFKFPTVDELNQPPMDTDLERKIKIEDSLRRAMEIATAEHERFLRLAATSYNKGTRKDCLREADNELKLYNICWQATNELWSERW